MEIKLVLLRLLPLKTAVFKENNQGNIKQGNVLIKNHQVCFNVWLFLLLAVCFLTHDSVCIDI